MTQPDAPRLPDGIVAFVKRDCPTCELVVPVLRQLEKTGRLTVYTQDDPAFPPGLPATDDRSLEVSWHHEIEAVPTVLRVESGNEVERSLGWHRGEWEALTGETGLGLELPETRPGCGSLSVDPNLAPELALRFSDSPLRARRVELASLEDDIEAMYQRGWSDGLPLVPPTEKRVVAMLSGTSRDPQEIVATVPPDLAACTVEKVAINAVMAGCKPEYLPVVLAAVEAACTPEFNIHGLLATTMPAGPVLIVNGPIRRRIGMNSGINLLGQGNRANSTIGRALQLVIRNVGGGRPGEVDRATQGNPGKLGMCFAEDEEGSPFEPFSTSMGIEAGVDCVTVLGAEAPRCVLDQLSRRPESLVRSLLATLLSVYHPKAVMGFDVMLVISPEHGARFRDAGWDRRRLVAELEQGMRVPGAELARGAGGTDEGVPEALAEAIRDKTIPKFRPGGTFIVHGGGGAGLFSSVLASWVNGQAGSQITAKEISPWK